MSNETMVATDAKGLAEQVRQNREDIERLKGEIEKLRAEIGLSETDEFEDQLTKDEVLEFGILGNSVIKGKINWVNPYLISVTTTEDNPAEILIFKQALAYIRKPEEKAVSRRGMYI